MKRQHPPSLLYQPSSASLQDSIFLLAGLIITLLCSTPSLFCHGSSTNGRGGWSSINSRGGRHSFSLSTFNPKGNLDQVEFAAEAAALGTPIVVVAPSTWPGVVMAAPQILPSPLLHDDGTSRFVRISPNLLVGHSGITADGRVVTAAAQQLAVEHEYAYDESIPLDIFLEELSLFFQEYTMKAGSRPFGVCLVVAHLANNSDDDYRGRIRTPQLFRVDPSGAVTSLGNYAVINGNKLQQDKTLLQQLQDIVINDTDDDLETVQTKLVVALEGALQRSTAPTLIQESSSSNNNTMETNNQTQPVVLPTNLRRFLTASLTHREGMIMSQRKVPRKEQ